MITHGVIVKLHNATYRRSLDFNLFVYLIIASCDRKYHLEMNVGNVTSQDSVNKVDRGARNKER